MPYSSNPYYRFDAYLASGWFNEDQRHTRDNILRITHGLGMSVFNPEAESLVDADSTLNLQAQVFNGNLNAINDSKMVIVNTAGKDMGTIFEAGYSFCLAKAIVYYCEGLKGNFNLMLAQSGNCVATSPEELEGHLRGLKIDPNYRRSYVGNIE